MLVDVVGQTRAEFPKDPPLPSRAPPDLQRKPPKAAPRLCPTDGEAVHANAQGARPDTPPQCERSISNDPADRSSTPSPTSLPHANLSLSYTPRPAFNFHTLRIALPAMRRARAPHQQRQKPPTLHGHVGPWCCGGHRRRKTGGRNGRLGNTQNAPATRKRCHARAGERASPSFHQHRRRG